MDIRHPGASSLVVEVMGTPSVKSPGRFCRWWQRRGRRIAVGSALAVASTVTLKAAFTEALEVDADQETTAMGAHHNTRRLQHGGAGPPEFSQKKGVLKAEEENDSFLECEETDGIAEDGTVVEEEGEVQLADGEDELLGKGKITKEALKSNYRPCTGRCRMQMGDLKSDPALESIAELWDAVQYKPCSHLHDARTYSCPLVRLPWRMAFIETDGTLVPLHVGNAIRIGRKTVVMRGRLGDVDVAVKLFCRHSRWLYKKEESVMGVEHDSLLTPILSGRIAKVRCIVSPLCHGGDLRNVVKKNVGRIPSSWKMKTLIQAAEGLAHLHEEGIVHRDVKPDNIFIGNTVDDYSKEPVVKVADFGFATPKKKLMRPSKRGIGTPLCFAPEIWQQRHGQRLVIDEKVDVFAFGVVMHFLFAEKTWTKRFGLSREYGKLVMQGKTPLDFEALVLPDAEAGLKSRLEALLKRCWALDPKDRPNMKSVVEELRHIAKVEKETAGREV